MRERLRIFLLLMLFWLSYMIFIRGLFLVYNHDLSAQLTAVEMLQTVTHGIRMDASMVGYVLALAGLLLMVSSFAAGIWLHRTLRAVTFTLLALFGLVVMVDLELYRHWGFRLNTTPFFYIGSGALGSVSPGVVVELIAIFFTLTVLYAWLYNRLISPYTSTLLTKGSRATAFVMLAVSGLLFFPIRGSISVAPMNTGFVFFHKSKPYANHTAINVVWNFLNSARKGSNVRYPENFVNSADAEARFAALYPASDSTRHLFKTPRPNIIFIIIESFTADVIEPLGGLPDIAPNLNKLCKEGILFDNFYASGDRTDKGLVSILSAYPAQPQTSIIKFPAKTQRMPQLNLELKKLGYRSSFVYGGDVDFANFRSFLTTGGFEHITSANDFPAELDASKWGVHDHFMFAQALHELDTTRSPFFKVILTLSSHEPFDVPMEPFIKGQDEESLFLNSCHYTDKSIGNFIELCKKQPWWDNTIVIMTADHGHRSPGNKELKDKRRFKTPLLIVGGAVRQDTVIHTLAGQTDIANTLLAQLDKPSPEFRFSKNILGNKVVPFAAYFFNDGFGFLLPDKHMVYDNTGKQFLEQTNITEEDIMLGKAYQQVLYSDYNKR
ncbi:LTA synthase family protein [Parachryseolinea silvisoli]|uniref:LTA synthase family protein n=1 Tax=Parachryseolinea silvisoli TaxID=2873601 RepID=UPI002265B431|nr:alkaline phosphatase family protein [Parachryseolinea silvisoli]MCD9017793.1 sulfatase-like hydrolase/transferase [Parachryseolinea silvisoli]